MPIAARLAVPLARVTVAPAAIALPAVTVPPDAHTPHQGAALPQYEPAPAIAGTPSVVEYTTKAFAETAPTLQAARAMMPQPVAAPRFAALATVKDVAVGALMTSHTPL